ncbi:serine-enriched protein-like [Ostrea edulis]|uniref:serine-enriched protein-like n=1 Tax=Ostrea edulis TaxID=37623 RepID=UPI0024AEC44A|nr:serine-enriched protein-like [Ostrea edulis]
MEHNKFGSTISLLRSHSTHQEGFSSGYDSNSEVNDEGVRWKVSESWQCRRANNDDTDSDVSATNSCTSESDDEDGEWQQEGAWFDKSDEESSDSEDEEESMKYFNTETVSEAMNYVMTMPDLCDVTFFVGSDFTPVHGVKAILSTRSRVFYQLILKATKELHNALSKLRKFKKKRHFIIQKPMVVISDVSVGIFTKIVRYIHTGRVDIKPNEVAELICAAQRYDVLDLVEICKNFLETCSSTCSIHAVLHSARKLQGHVIAQKIVVKMTERLSNLEASKTMLFRNEVFQ